MRYLTVLFKLRYSVMDLKKHISNTLIVYRRIQNIKNTLVCKIAVSQRFSGDRFNKNEIVFNLINVFKSNL